MKDRANLFIHRYTYIEEWSYSKCSGHYPDALYLALSPPLAAECLLLTCSRLHTLETAVCRRKLSLGRFSITTLEVAFKDTKGPAACLKVGPALTFNSSLEILCHQAEVNLQRSPIHVQLFPLPPSASLTPWLLKVPLNKSHTFGSPSQILLPGN